MKKIFKYALEVTSDQRIELPRGAKILTLQVQDHEVFLWAEVDPGALTVFRNVIMVGTGWDVPMVIDLHDCEYLGTVQMRGGFVWHYYIQPERLA